MGAAERRGLREVAGVSKQADVFSLDNFPADRVMHFACTRLVSGLRLE